VWESLAIRLPAARECKCLDYLHNDANALNAIVPVRHHLDAQMPDEPS
jgi:hypothetical protein